MKKTSRLSPKRVIYQFIIAQLIVSLLLSLVFVLLISSKAGASVLLAGLICVVSNSLFTWYTFRYWRGARKAKSFVIAFCLGEMMKLFIQGLLFVLAVCFLNIAVGPFMVGFIVNLMIFWLAPFIQFGLIDRRSV